MNHRPYLLSLLLVAISLQLTYAQPARPADPKPPLKDRLYTGGIIGLQFGTVTFIELAPIIGYMVTPKLSAGVGLKYMYYKETAYGTTYSNSSYGGSIFSRYFLLENLFAHVETEVLNLEVQEFYGSRRMNITSVFLGGGYRQMLGERSGIDLMILANLNESRYSPYPNPVIRIGMGIGF
jgi:hypothetical protein